MTSPQSDSQEQHQDDGNPDKSRQEQEEQDGGARQHESLQILTLIRESINQETEGLLGVLRAAG